MIDITTPMRAEATIWLRMLGDNIWIASLPSLLFVWSSAVHTQHIGNCVPRIFLGVLWSLLFICIFDSTNQASHEEEDRINKPHRPIPSGLITAQRMWSRTYVIALAYLFTGIICGLVPFLTALAWTVTVFVTHRYLRPQHYIFWKPVTTLIGTLSQLAGSWAVIQPLNGTTVIWVVTVSIMFIIAQPIEDVRDVDGDRAVGRITLPMVFGRRIICRYFVMCMAIWPAIAWAILYRNASFFAQVLATAMMCLICWSAGYCALLAKTNREERRAYIWYSFVHVVLVGSSILALG